MLTRTAQNIVVPSVGIVDHAIASRLFVFVPNQIFFVCKCFARFTALQGTDLYTGCVRTLCACIVGDWLVCDLTLLFSRVFFCRIRMTVQV